MTFPEALRKAMGDLSQDKVAELSGVHQTTISRYLRGAADPTLGKLESLERALPALRKLRAAA
jgi:transcriptional regulator with XRE-family HTH domain